MKVIQILPELNSGGVERGTLEVSKYLISQNHQSLVISHGGRLVAQLEQEGGIHITLPVHQKRLSSLAQVHKLKQIFEREKPDIIHIRSRLPAWLTWLAWKQMKATTRPHIISTFHGFYSVNAYSAIMTKGEKIIAVSESVKNYILQNYPKVATDRITVIHRGIDPMHFPCHYQPADAWMTKWNLDFPQCHGKKLLLLPGRITRWKGQEDYLHMIAALVKEDSSIHGLLAGEVHPRKKEFLGELEKLAATLGVSEHVTFLGHRSDLRELMSISQIVYSLSRDPEAFGRVSLEAMGLGKPVIATNHGGVAEQLSMMLPEGLIPLKDKQALLAKSKQFLLHAPTPKPIAHDFLIRTMLDSTLDVYQSALT